MDGLDVLMEDLKRIAAEGGIDLFGVADLGPARAFVEEQGGAFLSAFPRGISIGMALSPAMVEQVADRQNSAAIKSYHYYIYEIINLNLNRVGALLARRLVQAGYRAYLVPASLRVDDERLRGVFSQKLAAHLAGHGWIGKSCLLVTEKYGARVRYATVLTDAPLEAGVPLERGCGECSRCVEICPPRAFKGVEFRPEDPREVRYDAHLCHRFLENRQKALGAKGCGLCVLVCDGSESS